MEITSLEELYDSFKSDKFDFSNCQILYSKTPSDCHNEECILGVDEAGRGPVLGPMVYAVSYVPKKKTSDLEEVGCADSKTLTEQKREELFSILCACDDYVGWAVNVISPNFISNKMLKRTKYSLNEIAEQATVQLIQSVLDKNIRVTEIYVDTVGPPEKYEAKLSKIFPGKKIVVAKKADSIYTIVSAASICAKVIRDSTIQNWRFTEDLTIKASEFGSGYPNDPLTKNFLNNNMDDIFGFPSLVRFSWCTAGKILDDDKTGAASVEWEEDEDFSPVKRESISKFFKPVDETTKQEMRHNFFKKSNLANVCYF